MKNKYTIEVCVGNIDDALIAIKYGVDRIELNCAMELSGLTPSLETLIYLKEHSNTKIVTMVRPRGGDFYYTNNEYEIMLKDAKNLLENGADGIVFGFLNKDKTIDIKRTETMTKLIHSYNKEAIFHKAIEETTDYFTSLNQLWEIGIDRVLTNAIMNNEEIFAGCNRFKQLNDQYQDKIELLFGGGVKSTNVKEILEKSSTKQIHFSAKCLNSTDYFKLDEEELSKLVNIINNI